MTRRRTIVFDLDGTLIDSDAALQAPFTALGIDPATVPLGLPLADACRQFGISVADYLDHYDPTAAVPFAGVDQMLGALPRWGVCSNKHPESGPPELERLGWTPDAAWFNPGYGPKTLTPIIDAMSLEPSDVVFVGDTGHDRRCAEEAGCVFALAGWNRRAERAGAAIVLEQPADVLDLLDGAEQQ